MQKIYYQEHVQGKNASGELSYNRNRNIPLKELPSRKRRSRPTPSVSRLFHAKDSVPLALGTVLEDDDQSQDKCPIIR
jgi:hypothetical protein